MNNSNSIVADQAQTLTQRYKRIFGGTPRLYQAPGRVNLIGEHTDYNDGFVMPAAIGFYTWAAIEPRMDRMLVVESVNFSERVEFNLDLLPSKSKGHWSDYVAGVAKIFAQSGIRLSGANLLIEGDVPQGAGLSSSASIEVAVGYAFMELTGQSIDRRTLALQCQKAENEFVGARCGIMDQFVSCHGKRDTALLLDCRSLEYRLLPLPANALLVICNTMVKHSVSGGEYNQRRAECEAGVKFLSQRSPKVRALRDVTLSDLAAYGGDLPEILLKRCRHVITENSRVLEGACALERKDIETFGQLMGESHRSLRDDFEVSCCELDLLVEVAQETEGVYGARMTGGGFGGCTINLVHPDFVEAFKLKISKGYERANGYRPEIHVCTAADGVSKLQQS